MSVFCWPQLQASPSLKTRFRSKIQTQNNFNDLQLSMDFKGGVGVFIFLVGSVTV